MHHNEPQSKTIKSQRKFTQYQKRCLPIWIYMLWCVCKEKTIFDQKCVTGRQTDGQTDRRTDMVKLCGPSQQVEVRKNCVCCKLITCNKSTLIDVSALPSIRSTSCSTNCAMVATSQPRTRSGSARDDIKSHHCQPSYTVLTQQFCYRVSIVC